MSVTPCVLGTHRGQNKALDPPETGERWLWATIWIPGINPRSSVRLASTLNCWVNWSPKPIFLIYLLWAWIWKNNLSKLGLINCTIKEVLARVTLTDSLKSRNRFLLNYCTYFNMYNILQLRLKSKERLWWLTVLSVSLVWILLGVTHRNLTLKWLKSARECTDLYCWNELQALLDPAVLRMKHVCQVSSKCLTSCKVVPT